METCVYYNTEINRCINLDRLKIIKSGKLAPPCKNGCGNGCKFYKSPYQISKEEYTALEGSIKKWEDICYHGGRDRGWYNCPLCKLHMKTCNGCIIGIDTQNTGCRSTPYTEWQIHRHTHKQRFPSFVQCPECYKLAIHFLAYLINLKNDCEVIRDN